MGSKYTQRTMNDLTLVLKSPSESTRLLALKRLVDSGRADLKEILTPLATTDRSPAVRYYAARLLKLAAGAPRGFGEQDRMDTNVPVSPPAPSPAAVPEIRQAEAPAAPAGGRTATITPEPTAPPPGVPPPAVGAVEDEPTVPLVDAVGTTTALLLGAPGSQTRPPTGPETEAQRLSRAALSVLKPCVRQLAELIDAEDLEVVAESALALGRLRATETFERIASLLKTASPDERLARALGDMGDPRGAEVLVRLYRDERWASLRPALATAICRVRSPHTDEFLRKALTDNDLAIQGIVIKHIAQTANERFLDLLVAKLGAVEDYFEITVIQALSRFSATHPRIMQHLLTRLSRESNPRTASCIISALSPGKEPALVDCIEKLTRERDRRVRANAAEAVSRLTVGIAIKMRILRQLLSDEDNRVRANAAKIMVKLGDRAAVEVVKGMLTHRDKWWRASACHALGECRPAGTVQLLSKALKDPDMDVRINATKALREIEDPLVPQLLMSMISDKNLWIRLYALETLGNLRLKGANQALRTALRQESNNQVMAAAVVAVGKTGTPESSSGEISRYISHINEKVRLAAVEAMDHVLTPENLGLVLPALKDTDRRVRAAAVKVLFKFGQLKVISSLYETLLKGPVEEQPAVAFAIGEVADVVFNIQDQPNVGRLTEALRKLPAYTQG
ncbi:MAG: HEAT repeat domain-containing protein [Candidatus Riflebacteria bacterium]|nr:HEAT repeat domain-containing protein [Candidatus Riflebacteria bacterium]